MKKAEPASPPPEYPFSPHERYFLRDDMVVLRVEDRLFRVSTRWLKTNSPRLKRAWDASVQNGPDEEAEPTLVPDVTVAQFEALLDYIDESTSSDFALPATRWVDLLAATHHLEIASIKPRVVREVFHNHQDAFRPVQLLSYHEAYAIGREDLRKPLRQLMDRPGPLSADEMREISYELIARIITMREEYLHSLSQPFGAWNASGKADALTDNWVKNG